MANILMKENVDFIKNFIDKIKASPCLYDGSSKDHSFVEKRAEQWQKIAGSLRLDIDFVKVRWRSLRDRYVREHRSVHENFKSQKQSNFIFYDYMKFLDPFVPSYKNNRMEKSISLTDDNDMAGDNRLIKRPSYNNIHHINSSSRKIPARTTRHPITINENFNLQEKVFHKHIQQASRSKISENYSPEDANVTDTTLDLEDDENLNVDVVEKEYEDDNEDDDDVDQNENEFLNKLDKRVANIDEEDDGDSISDTNFIINKMVHCKSAHDFSLKSAESLEKYVATSAVQIQYNPNKHMSEIFLNSGSSSLTIDEKKGFENLTTEKVFNSQDNENDLFCKSISKTLKKLKRINSIKAKVEIFQVLEKYIRSEENGNSNAYLLG